LVAEHLRLNLNAVLIFCTNLTWRFPYWGYRKTSE